MSEITTSNANDVNTVNGQLKILQQKISAMETKIHGRESFRLLSSIMGGRNELANLSSRNKFGD